MAKKKDRKSALLGAVKKHLAANWMRYALGLATSLAAAYAGPDGAAAVQKYLPAIARALGLV